MYIIRQFSYIHAVLKMSAHLIQSAMEEEMVQNQIMRERDAQNKKKRTKVTDTRLSPRTSAKPGELQSMNTPVKSEFTLDQAALANKAAFDGMITLTHQLCTQVGLKIELCRLKATQIHFSIVFYYI